ncbi:Cytochrome b561 and DOMON domain-containing protein [Drosera capensis]
MAAGFKSEHSFVNLVSLILVMVLLSEHGALLGLADETGNLDVESEFCNNDLTTFLPPPYGNLSNVRCQLVWNTFILRYSQSRDHVVTFVLSALYTTGWVGIGFSKDGMMPGANAMVGWISKTGHARIKQYHLKGYKRSEVIPGKGFLNFTSIPPVVVLDGANIYLAFQLQFASAIKRQPTLLAYSSKYPVNHELSVHDDKLSMVIDYSTAALPVTASVDHSQMKRSHGILGILGWGLFLPIGAMVARFMKQKEPLWFYLHTIIQFISFFVVVSGVVVGQALYNSIHADVSAHRGIGYFALTLCILQVIAFFIRPDKESKFRRLWRTYHGFVGVLALLFGSVNIVYGIQIGSAGTAWKIGYGFLLGTLLIVAAILQVLSMMRSSEHKVQSPASQINGL